MNSPLKRPCLLSGRFRSFFQVLAALGLGLPFGFAAKPAPALHREVGQRFVATDVEWPQPVYQTTFDDDTALQDWRLEGGKRAGIENGKLVLESTGGDNHLVYWLRTEVPADFLLEFTVRPQNRREGLNIVFFNMRGRGDESVLDPALPARDGAYPQYHSGALNGYHISYWASGRGSANLRKSHGFQLVASGRDFVGGAPADAFQTIRLYKRGGKIRLMVDDIIAIAFDDGAGSEGPAWTHSGWIALRQMGHTVRCEYDHLKVFRLKP